MKEQFLDCLGIPFASHTEWLPDSTRDWPMPFVDHANVLQEWRANWAGKPCWWCGGATRSSYGSEVGELHHLKTGIEEPWIYTWLCAGCHRIGGEAVKADSLGRLLWLKWRHDPAHTYWHGIALRLRRRLPDLIIDLPSARRA